LIAVLRVPRQRDALQRQRARLELDTAEREHGTVGAQFSVMSVVVAGRPEVPGGHRLFLDLCWGMEVEAAA
jgi:hypothetical protein